MKPVQLIRSFVWNYFSGFVKVRCGCWAHESHRLWCSHRAVRAFRGLMCGCDETIDRTGRKRCALAQKKVDCEGTWVFVDFFIFLAGYRFLFPLLGLAIFALIAFFAAARRMCSSASFWIRRGTLWPWLPGALLGQTLQGLDRPSRFDRFNVLFRAVCSRNRMLLTWCWRDSVGPLVTCLRPSITQEKLKIDGKELVAWSVSDVSSHFYKKRYEVTCLSLA